MKASIRLSYVQSKDRTFSASQIGDNFNYYLKQFKDDFYKSVREAVQTASSEPWLDVWETNISYLADKNKVPYADITFMITKFKKEPNLSKILPAVKRVLDNLSKKGFTGTMVPGETSLDVDDEDFRAVYISVKISPSS